MSGHDHGGLWIGSHLDIHTCRNLCSHMTDLVGPVGPTALQVGASLAAVVCWGIKNPNSGANFPENLPSEEIVALAKPWLGKFISVISNWNPKPGVSCVVSDPISVASSHTSESEEESDDSSSDSESEDSADVSREEIRKRKSSESVSSDRVSCSPPLSTSPLSTSPPLSTPLSLLRKRTSRSPSPPLCEYPSSPDTWQFSNFLVTPLEMDKSKLNATPSLYSTGGNFISNGINKHDCNNSIPNGVATDSNVVIGVI